MELTPWCGWGALLRIEVLRKISGVEFEDCRPRRVFIDDDDLRIPAISLVDTGFTRPW
jgi:hypothetical protein